MDEKKRYSVHRRTGKYGKVLVAADLEYEAAKVVYEQEAKGWADVCMTSGTQDSFEWAQSRVVAFWFWTRA